MDYGAGFPQGSGVPQPWALLFNPFRIKNASKVVRKNVNKEWVNWITGNMPCEILV